MSSSIANLNFPHIEHVGLVNPETSYFDAMRAHEEKIIRLQTNLCEAKARAAQLSREMNALQHLLGQQGERLRDLNVDIPELEHLAIKARNLLSELVQHLHELEATQEPELAALIEDFRLQRIAHKTDGYTHVMQRQAVEALRREHAIKLAGAKNVVSHWGTQYEDRAHRLGDMLAERRDLEHEHRISLSDHTELHDYAMPRHVLVLKDRALDLCHAIADRDAEPLPGNY